MSKYSIVLSTQPTKFAALAYESSIAENIRKIIALGFDGVELAVRDPKILDVSKLLNILNEHNCPVSAIGTGQAFGEEGLSFTDPDIKIRQRAIERIKSQIELAAKLNTIVIIGLIRGQSIPESGKAQAEEWLIEGLNECAAFNPVLKMAIEPINRYESKLLNTVAETLAFLDKLNLENVGLLLDTFHMNIEEPELNKSIIAADNKIYHVHIADSNRWYPGAGHLDFKTILNTLEDIGYSGFISGEILPMPDPDTSARKTIEFLQNLNLRY